MIRRLRPFILIAGRLLCVLIVVTFAVSGWWQVMVDIPYGPTVYVNAGGLAFGMPDLSGELSYHAYQQSHGFRFWFETVWWDNGWVVVPLVFVFAVVAAATLLVWRFVPKFPRGHCRRCGYNLTGLTEARCPECGAGFELMSDSPCYDAYV